MAHRAVIGWFNFFSRFGGTITGGDWQAGLPLEKLRGFDWRDIAESVDDDPSSTRFDIDFGAERPVGLIHIGGIRVDPGTENLCTVQVTASDGGAVEVYDSTALTLWDGSLDWETLSRSKFFVLPENTNIQTISVDFSIESGVLQVGTVGAYLTWEATHNFAFGWGQTFQDRSDVTRLPGGSPVIVKREVGRRLNFEMPAISVDDDDYKTFNIMLGANGRSETYAVSLFADSPVLGGNNMLERTSIYGFQSADPAWTNPFFKYLRAAFSIDQV